MIPVYFRTVRRGLFAVLVLALGGLGATRAQPAHADISVCRSDPVVLLSNGTVVDLTVVVNDAPSDIQRVGYVLHGPAGTQVVRVVYSAEKSNLESLTFYADLEAGGYAAGALVSTVASTTAAVELSARAWLPGSRERLDASGTGLVNQLLTVVLR